MKNRNALSDLGNVNIVIFNIYFGKDNNMIMFAHKKNSLVQIKVASKR